MLIPRIWIGDRRSAPAASRLLTYTSTNKFLFDRDQRGAPLELAIADSLHYRNIPFGFNPYTGTEDPRREDYDFYIGQPGAEAFWEAKMDWVSAFSKNLFIEEKTLRNTKADKFAIGLLYVHTFDTKELVDLYNAKQKVRRADGTFAEQYLYKHVAGGDQAGNMGMLLPREVTKTVGQPFWKATRELTQ